MRNDKFTLLALVFIFLFHACKKESVRGSEGTRLQMTVSTSNDSVAYRTFVYDDQNRLIAFLDSTNSWPRHRVFLEYNSEGHPFKTTEHINGSYDGSFTQTSFSLVFDAEGRVIKKLIPTSSGSIVQNTYGYDAKNRLIADSGYRSWTGKSSHVTFSYDANDNMIEKKEFDAGSGAITQHLQMSYDSRSNPFKHHGPLLYFLTGEDLSLNKNNRVRTEYQDGTVVTGDYEYNSQGWPKRLAEKDNTDPLISYTDFSYD